MAVTWEAEATSREEFSRAPLVLQSPPCSVQAPWLWTPFQRYRCDCVPAGRTDKTETM